MANDDVKTPSELADEARQTGRDALNAAHFEATQTANAARAVAEDAHDLAEDALQTGRAHGWSAVDAAQRRVSALKDQVTAQACAAQESCTRYIAREPVKATLMAVAGGALLTGLVLSSLRGRRG